MPIELAEERKVEIEILETRRELEGLTDQQLILRSLSSIIMNLMPSDTYYYTMANVLRERAEGKSKEKVWR